MRRCVGLFGIALMAATWRLWIPQSEFPQVPLLGQPWGLPEVTAWSAWPQWLALASMLLGLISLLFADSPPGQSPTGASDATAVTCWQDWIRQDWIRRAAWGLPLGWLLAVITDQHRLQPWAYQFAALTVLFAIARPAAMLTLARLLTIGIYFWSAVSKFDFQFVHTVGADMVTQLARFVGWDLAAATSPTLEHSLAVLPPLVELLVAGLLLAGLLIGFSSHRFASHRFRMGPIGIGQIGVGLAVAMHCVLLLVLGPVGLNHLPAVLLWNLYFIAQVLLLFGPVQSSSPSSWSSLLLPGSRTGFALVLVMLGMPIGERWGYWDHWPAWALYAPHSSRVTMWVSTAAVTRLPASLQRELDANSQASEVDQPGWVRLPLDRWSLGSVGAPIYPQDRFQLGVAIAVAEQAGLDRDLHVELRGPASRFSGARQRQQLGGLPAIRQAAERFYFNASPRRFLNRALGRDSEGRAADSWPR
ncbi:hypothetical protein SH139x_004780 [Planctomycetaceae bacterium SH139]